MDTAAGGIALGIAQLRSGSSAIRSAAHELAATFAFLLATLVALAVFAPPRAARAPTTTEAGRAAAPSGQLRLGQERQDQPDAPPSEFLVPRPHRQAIADKLVERPPHRHRDACLRPSRRRGEPGRARRRDLPRRLRSVGRGLPHCRISSARRRARLRGAQPRGRPPACAEARDPLSPTSLLPAGQPHFLGVIVEVNPVSPRDARPDAPVGLPTRGLDGIGPGDALFGSFVGLFVRQIGNADRTLRFRTQSVTP